ncbi:MAG: haloalkane dehalogenase [Syntrophales bacterium]|jgi:haloalkane dehalogenase|nr:haloalkane dehalogenase [Syntrophales bacterium]MDY0043559.1 haloalkane dehalogenase [Syntrophales bacterium]
MNFIVPESEELRYLRPDPVLWEQELDFKPEIAKALESTIGKRSGISYWRSEHGHLYAIELADLGRNRPSMATIYGHWDRMEPRPPEHEINRDLLDFLLWFSEETHAADPKIVNKLAHVGNNARLLTWPEGSVLRTPDERFEMLPDFPYEPHYQEIEGLRMAYVKSGSGDPILMLHGEPTWSFLYRKMIPALSGFGEVYAPDLIGFGRSDKPVLTNAYTYKSHVRWMRRFIEKLDLTKITLICQDWGGSIGLRVLAEIPERFKALVAMNTGITPGVKSHQAFDSWRFFSQRSKELDLPGLMNITLTLRKLTDAEAAAYAAPFPSREYQTCALLFPRLVPIRPDQPGAYDNRQAIEILKTLELPVFLLWGGADAITKPSESYLRKIFKNVAPPAIIEGAGHFIQEDAGEEAAAQIAEWMKTKRL